MSYEGKDEKSMLAWETDGNMLLRFANSANLDILNLQRLLAIISLVFRRSHKMTCCEHLPPNATQASCGYVIGDQKNSTRCSELLSRLKSVAPCCNKLHSTRSAGHRDCAEHTKRGPRRLNPDRKSSDIPLYLRLVHNRCTPCSPASP